MQCVQLNVKNVNDIKCYNQYVPLCVKRVRPFESVTCPVLWGLSLLCALWRSWWCCDAVNRGRRRMWRQRCL